MAEAPQPKNRRDIALILKLNEFNIYDTADEIIAILNLDEEKHDSVTSLLKRIQSQIRKSKKNVDQLNIEWCNCPIPWEPKSLDITPSDTSTSLYTQSNVKKNLFSLRLPQQRIRLSSILEQIRETATIEGSTPVEIAALALQLLANEVEKCKTAKVAKGIVSSGGFSGINLKYVPVDKALFLLDLLEFGRRKHSFSPNLIAGQHKFSILQLSCRFAKRIGIKKFNTALSRSSSTDRCTNTLLHPG